MLHRSKYLLIITLTILTTTQFTAASLEEDIVSVGNFSKMQLTGWKEKSFSGNTDYALKEQHGNYFLEATANKSASALYKRISVDLNKTPYLNWSWSITEGLPPQKEQTKEGDDYAARVYVIVKLGAFPWQTFALNYVWSSNTQKSNAWPNAYLKNAIMIPKRSKVDPHGEWIHEKVNVREDLKRHLGKDIKKVNGVAVMTDTDNSEEIAIGMYGDIFFSAN